MALNSPFNYEIHGGHRHYDYRYPNGEDKNEEQRLAMQPYWARKEMEKRDDNVVNSSEKFAVQLNVGNFHPEELKVSLVGRHLCVEGHHEEKKDGHGMVSRSFKRSYLLPKDCDLDGISSHLSDHGILNVEAPKFRVIEMSQYMPQAPYASQLNVDTIDDGMYRSVPQRSPLTKQVNQLAYEIPRNKYAQNPWNYAPEFLKVMGDVRTHVGGRAIFDCVLLGSPRPRVTWLFNDDKFLFTDVEIIDNCDVCRLVIPYVQPYHFGQFTVLCENEVGRAVASAELLPL